MESALNTNKLLPEVKQLLAPQSLKMYINGRWLDAASGKIFETFDPGNGSFLTRIAAGDVADVAQAVAAADEAFCKSGWATVAGNPWKD